MLFANSLHYDVLYITFQININFINFIDKFYCKHIFSIDKKYICSDFNGLYRTLLTSLISLTLLLILI